MTDQLLPCPFCGSPAEFSGRNAAGELCPACSMCSCRALSVLDWNTRAQPADCEPKPVLRIAGGDVIPEAKILHGDWRALPHGTELFTRPAPAGAVLPERKELSPFAGYDKSSYLDRGKVDGWNACREETARLNGVKP